MLTGLCMDFRPSQPGPSSAVCMPPVQRVKGVKTGGEWREGGGSEEGGRGGIG
jgi:hypothetical protein